MGSNPYTIYTGKAAASASGGSSSGRSLFGRLVHDAAGVATNLGTDVKDAAFGIPEGIVQTVEHPIHSAEMLGKATWHDWSPLFHGNVHQFLHQTYEHPLAPLLDIATVFSAGAGTAARLGKIGEAAGLEGKLVKGAADLGRAKKVDVQDMGRITKGEAPRPVLVKTYGPSAGANARRLLVNKALSKLEEHGRVPKSFEASAREGRLYNRLHYIDLAHRHAAMNYTINRLMTAGKLASDPSVQHIIQPHVLSQNYWEMRKFAHAIDANGPIPAGYIPVKEMTDPAMFNHIPGVNLETRLRNFANPKTEGSFVTTAKKEAAHVNGGKQILVVPHHTLKALGHEAGDSTRALSKFAKSPVTWWKRAQVGYAPRVITNNVMGNWTMYALRTAGRGGGRAIVDAVRHAHGERAAMQAFKDMHAQVVASHGAEAGAHFTALAHPHMIDAPNITAIEKTYGKTVADAVRKNPDWVNRHFKTELGSTFGNVLTDGVKTRESKLVQQGLYPLVHRVADRPVRVAALYHFMRRSPEVQGFLRNNPGVTLDKAISKVLDRNPNALRARAEAHVRSIAGDYSTMSPRERMLQNFVPFYLWDKHIVKHVANMVNERPGALDTLAKTGDQGTATGKKLLGNLPEFMQGALPIPGLDKGGRKALLMTTGLNPYHTIGDLAQAITAATTRHDATSGADAANNLSPLITGLVEQLSGHKLGTQAPVATHGGVVPSALANMFGTTTYGTLIAKALGEKQAKPKTNKPFLYDHSTPSTVTSLFGLPLREASLARAHQMAAQEAGTKSTTRRTRSRRSIRG